MSGQQPEKGVEEMRKALALAEQTNDVALHEKCLMHTAIAESVRSREAGSIFSSMTTSEQDLLSPKRADDDSSEDLTRTKLGEPVPTLITDYVKRHNKNLGSSHVQLMIGRWPLEWMWADAGIPKMSWFAGLSSMAS